jgi:N-acetylmuramoyl-L-alanine amidase
VEVAIELERRLRGRGFEVVMTRRRDVFVSLEERTALAEGAGGDVFVSVHVNAAPRRSASGIETYYLDRSHERHTLRVAARENGVPPSHLDPLQRAVAGLRVGEVSGHSQELAATVHRGIVSGVREVFGSVQDLGVKQGPFHVLFLSAAPSILVEMGFLTNRGDARRLESKLYRAVLAEQIARGLSRYRSQRATMLARRSP